MNNVVVGDGDDPMAIVTPLENEERKPPSEGKRPRQRKRREKVKDDQFAVLKPENRDKLTTKDYRVSQLRQMCRHYGVKRSGNKNELVSRLRTFLDGWCSASHVQSAWRGFVVRKFMRSKGLARGSCRPQSNNEDDFLTMEPVKTIPVEQVFYFTDSNNFTYGFNIISLYNLVLREGNLASNPYTRQALPKTVAKNLIQAVRFGKLLGFGVDVKLEEEEEKALESMSPHRRLEMRTIDICQRIDALGNHTNVGWLLDLNSSDFQLLLRELWDIWHYRANVPIETRRMICPPRGDPFANVDLALLGGTSQQNIWRVSLSVLERFVNAGINTEAKGLGAVYVLTALTLVSTDAALALPWLYQSVAHA